MAHPFSATPWIWSGLVSSQNCIRKSLIVNYLCVHVCILYSISVPWSTLTDINLNCFSIVRILTVSNILVMHLVIYLFDNCVNVPNYTFYRRKTFLTAELSHRCPQRPETMEEVRPLASWGSTLTFR